jgi:plasmid stabilization system protein ParE
MELRIDPAARQDIEKGVDWYDLQRFGLGEEFLRDVELRLRDLVIFPERWPVVRRDVRRALLPRFPHLLFYRVLDDEVVVIACVHPKRHVKHWPV